MSYLLQVLMIVLMIRVFMVHVLMDIYRTRVTVMVHGAVKTVIKVK